MTTDDEEVILRRPRHPRSASRAWQALRKSLAGWGASGIEDAAPVVLSELLTNDLRHAHGTRGRDVETRFARLGSGAAQIGVHDAASELPVMRPYDPCAESGRGLPLVAALAEEWGTTARNGPGKRGWAELRTPSPPP
ncbi:ATP-binding protein [Streptomyces flavofungini]|uniref:ATP-binding protein n=1 Tax=Streptomyces flavofungini TaxID=68200 RepID=UPI0025B0AD6F|nr:ATP-binding protein [Streptomyces flavofungini]WJV46610.1 ATP-binding protein [Streptomyces flavofungini]